MAKKKKGGKKSGGRRVGASKGKKNETIMTVAGAAIGVLGTILLDSKLLSTVNGKIKGAGELFLGGFAAYKAKNPLIKGIGYGMAAWGASRAVTSLTGMTISGIGCTSIAGFRDVAQIGAAPSNIRKFPSPAAVGNNRTRAAMAASGAI